MSDAPRLTTTLNRKWLTKMFIFMAALFILGIWGTADAFWIYPKRGEAHAKFMLRDYLDKLASEGALVRLASVPDPAAEYARLSAANPDPSSVDGARYAWLESVGRVDSLARLTRENQAAQAAGDSKGPVDTQTIFADPTKRLADVKAELANRNVPKPLSAYDIPLQYVFAIVGFAGGFWMVFFLARNKGIRYEYDPAAKRLFVPGGRSFTPADITDVDKRDWHKYFIYLKINGFDGEQKFDLLRYAPLEDWVEEMRKLRPGYDPAEDEKPEEPADDATPDPQATGEVPEESTGVKP
jgi:hypothetical protein